MPNSTLEREFFRTQAEAGIGHAPWARNTCQRAAGLLAGLITVGVAAFTTFAAMFALLTFIGA